MNGFHDIDSGPKDTFAELSAQQREQLRQHRIQEAKDAFKLINRVSQKGEWPEEDLAMVLAMLDLTGESGTDRGSYGGPMIPMSEPGYGSKKRRSG